MRFIGKWYTVYFNDLLYFSYCLQRSTIENPGKPGFEVLRDAVGTDDPIGYFNRMYTGDMETLPPLR